jgi:tetratricopeptide (TPR) repeat protein
MFSYSEALEVTEDLKLRAGVATKLAGTNLVLGRYDAALSDALLSRTQGPSDWKAYFTAGRAAYGLCEYGTSKEYFEKALELNSSAAAVKKEYARCLARLKEEETGEYDFAAMSALLTPQNVHLDCGSFVSNTIVKDSPLHGRGIFAARNIKAGELIFAEKATFMPNQYDPDRASAALYAMMVRQLYDNPSLSKSVLTMYSADFPRTGSEGSLVDGLPVVDVYLLESIRLRNCFSAPLSTVQDTKPTSIGGRQAKGLWIYAAYMNHNCVPNSMRSFLGDMLLSRATRDIAEGDEIFQQYVPVKALPDVRAALYQKGWGFSCACRLCEGEGRSPAATQDKRRELLAAVERINAKKDPARDIMTDAVIRSVDRLMRQLEDLHEPEIYEGLPRLTLVYPSNWLVAAHRGRKNWAKVLKYGIKTLRNFGFSVPADETESWDPTKIYDNSEMASLMTIHAVTTLRDIGYAYQALGHPDMATRCEEASTFGYKMVTGFENHLSILDS